MAAAKLSILGNDYVGAFALATDSFCMVGRGATKGERASMQKALESGAHGMSVNGSDLIGIYAAGNSNALLFPKMAYSDELSLARKELHGIEVSVFDTDLNALGNNILANDRLAVINPNYTAKEAKAIAELLDVEVIKMAIGPFETVGANNLLTNKGIVLNNKVTEQEESMLKELFHNVSQSTANTGALSIGLCAVANSRGIVVGKSTTGYELVNMTDGLVLE